MAQRIQEQVGILPAIEAERHFVKIGREMLCADFMPCTYNAALQQGESRFHGIRMDFSFDIDPVLVANGFVRSARESSLHHSFGICCPFIGDNYFNITADVFFDKRCQSARLSVLSMEESQIAATLTDANYHFFVLGTASASTVAPLAANVGFVHFHSTVQQDWLVFFHGSTNAMAEIPCGLVAHSQSTFDLISRHSLAGLAQQKCCHKPSTQGEMGIVEHGSSRDAELVFALPAPYQLGIRFEPDNVLRLTARAFRAEGPAKSFQQFAAFIIGREQFCNFRERHCEYPD